MDDDFRFSHRLALSQAYAGFIKEAFDQDWYGYLFTFMFDHIPGSREARINQMQKDIYHWYGRLLTRLYRYPRSPKYQGILPKGVFFPDSPVPKHEKQNLMDVIINDGLHCHGVLMAHDWGRLGCPLHLHTQRKQRSYLTGNLRRVHADQITDAPAYVADYALKALKRPGSSLDHVLVLPRSTNEFSR